MAGFDEGSSQMGAVSLIEVEGLWNVQYCICVGVSIRISKYILWCLQDGWGSNVMSHNIHTTNANGFQLVLKLGASGHPFPPTRPVIGLKPDIGFYQTPTLLPLIVIILCWLIPSDPVLAILVHILDSSLLHPHYL